MDKEEQQKARERKAKRRARDRAAVLAAERRYLGHVPRLPDPPNIHDGKRAATGEDSK